MKCEGWRDRGPCPLSTKGYELFNYCEECSKNLCTECMQKGWCRGGLGRTKHKPANHGGDDS